MRMILFCITLPLLAAGLQVEVDRLDSIKQMMAQADCNRFDFLSILESDVFQSVDTVSGSAYIAGDGRYAVEIGPDQYYFDLERLWSYSSDNNQVTIERAASGLSANEEVSFITRLDEYYSTKAVRPGYEYHLFKLDSMASNIPDSLRLFVHPEDDRIEMLEFYDLNEDLNRIVILSHEAVSECDSKLLTPWFPDTVEIIRLD